MRSGYAFAHSEGFGRLITSGRIMKEVKTKLFEFALKKLFFRLVDWGEVVARVPMARTRARVKSQEGKAMGRAMEQEAGGEYLEDLLRSSPFLLGKSRTSSLVSRQTNVRTPYLKI